jgi:dihydrofolate synthase/folylpolyglutamate synthase
VSHGGTVSKLQHGLTYLNGLTPWNGRGGFALEGITKVLRRIDNPQDSYPTIHIAGTNGKGTVSSAIASILAAAGNTVGLNTSPHLQSLNERVIVNGMPISMDALGELAWDIRNAAAKEFMELSFHEAITAISFLAFREFKANWAVIEVGLGGRLDASNVISRPSATSIVTIDYDHQHILGNTLGEIAAEKAGIIKPGVPLISGSLPREAEIVVSRLAKGVRHYRYGSEYGCERTMGDSTPTIGYWGKDFPGNPIVRSSFVSPLEGQHQAHNLSVAATIGFVVGMPETAVIQGIENVYWPARMELLEIEGRGIVMDCAHNPAGIRAFVAYLDSIGERDIDLTFGVLDTKNWQEMIGILRPYVSQWRIVLPESERALPLEQVEAEIRLSRNDIRVTAYGSDYDRLTKDIISSGDIPRRFVTGSMYMIGRLRNLLGVPIRPLWPPVL